MGHIFLSRFKGVCADAMQYGICVAVNRYKYDSAKMNGIFDEKSLLRMHRAILKYLRKKNKHLIEKYNNDDLNVEGEVTAFRKTIWCFWWQGIEASPDLVKACIESIRRENKDCNIVIIDKNTYKDYVDIPAYIINKVDKGSISYTHFSDILRFNLLKQHGGIWMDSTVFCVNPLKGEYLTAPFFTPRSQPRVSECIANFNWACYLMAGNSNHILFNYIVDFYNFYFQEHDTVLHYFLTDYCIQLAYENIPRIRAILDAVPINNERRGELTKHLCDPFSEEYSLKSLKKDTDFYKLFWKQECRDYTDDGLPTVWHKLKSLTN